MIKREDWIWLAVIAGIICVTVIVVAAISGYNKRITAMMENGYEEMAYPGSPGTYWHKAKP